MTALGGGRGPPDAWDPNGVKRVVNIRESLPWPGPSSTTSGKPLPSPSWWTLVDKPPRERPIA